VLGDLTTDRLRAVLIGGQIAFSRD